jgi:hypothetical protein
MGTPRTTADIGRGWIAEVSAMPFDGMSVALPDATLQRDQAR